MTESPERQNRTFFNSQFVRTEKRRSYRLAFVLFWSILMYLFFSHYVISLGIIREASMVPTLPEGGYYLVNKYIYYFTRPKRGDIIILRQDVHTPEIVKRVVGLEGETLVIKGGHVYINGRRLSEHYALGPTYPDFGPYRIEKDTYFILGDNREVSQDSRNFGAVLFRNIEGKIRPGVLFPFY
ncbi:MAG: signal peptidase I [Candidatus Methylomirabilales bacterium]